MSTHAHFSQRAEHFARGKATKTQPKTFALKQSDISHEFSKVIRVRRRIRTHVLFHNENKPLFLDDFINGRSVMFFALVGSPKSNIYVYCIPIL